MHEIISTMEARDLIRQLKNYYLDLAEWHKQDTGLVPIIRRCHEMLMKVSAILAIGNEEGKGSSHYLRTREHVEFAFNVIEEDLNTKLTMLKANIAKEDNNPSQEVINRILSMLSTESGKSAGEIKRIIRNKDKLIDACLKELMNRKIIRLGEAKSTGGRPARRYFLND